MKLFYDPKYPIYMSDLRYVYLHYPIITLKAIKILCNIHCRSCP